MEMFECMFCMLLNMKCIFPKLYYNTLLMSMSIDYLNLKYSF